MSKLVDKERLAQLAKALDSRMKAAVAAEAEVARAAEQRIETKADANAVAIAAINDAEKGLLAQAAAAAAKDATEKVAAEKERAEGVEGNLNTRLTNMESTFKGAVDNFFDGAAEGTKVAEMVVDIAENAKQIGVNAQAIADETERAEEQEGILAGKIAALELKVNGGEGEGQDSIDDKIAAAEAKAAELDKADREAQAEIDSAQDAAIALKVAKADYDVKVKALDDEDARIAGLVKAEEDRAKEVEEDHEERIAANEAFVSAQPAIDAEQNRRIKALEDDAPVKQAAIEAAQKAADDAQDAADAAQADVDAVEERLDAEGGLVDRIEANEANIARLDGAVDVEGSVKKQIADAIAGVKSDVTDGLADRVDALETFKNTTYPAAEAKVREDFAAADATNLQAAKDYADQQITALVDSAPDAMNTLNELAGAISANKGVYDAYVEQHAAAMTKMKEDLQKEIDDDVKAVVDAQKLVNDAQAEINEDIEGRVAANEAFVKAQPAIDQEQDRRIKALEDANAEGGAMAVAVKAAKDAADAAKDAADDAQADVDAIEERLDAEGGLVARIAANEAAIKAEVETDRDAAIVAALEAYSTTEEMKQVIGNVVNSLALTMENDKVVLKLGGVDGIALTSVDLDMATDEDIDEIIAGLGE